MMEQQKIKPFLAWVLGLLAFLSLSVCARAQDVSVSALVPDSQPPTVPILISPEDGAIISDNTPAFKWYASSDNNGLSHYALYLNNNLLYDQIPLSAVENSNYKLEFDHLNGFYTLTVKKSLSDRTYQWKIVAVDYANLKASSDIWDFTIDTLAPNFTLSQIGDTAVRISASEVGSVPTEPILIFKNDATANEPILKASGEAYSQVKLTVTIPNDLTQVFNTQIDKNGVYEIKLGILPRDVDIRLDFIITDRVNHVSVLEKVYFRIALQYWPTAASPTQGSPTPDFSVTPSVSLSIKPSISASPSSSLSPTPSLSVTPSLQPSGFVPILPPKEMVHELSDELIEFLPSDAAWQVKNFLRSQAWLNLAPNLFLLFFVFAYFLAFVGLLSKFWHFLSWKLCRKLVLLMLPFLPKAKKNLVFEYSQTTASPLSIVSLLDDRGQEVDFTLTNLQGNFDDFKLLPKQWSLRVKDPNFYFPIGETKPEQLAFWQFYQGQIFDQQNYCGQAILLPTLRAAGQKHLPFWENCRILILYLLEYPWWFLSTLLVLNLLFTLRYPSLANYLILGFYILVAMSKIVTLKKFAKKLSITLTIDAQTNFNDNLIVSLSQANYQSAQSVVLPFNFAKSKEIKHSLTQGQIVVFAKNLALVHEQKIVAMQQFVCNQAQTSLPLILKKVK